MSDFLVGLAFWLVYEIFSWPMRLALAPIPMSADVRRMISRVAGPAIIGFTVWVAGHVGVPLGWGATWLWFAAFMFLAHRLCRLQGMDPDMQGFISLIWPFSNPLTRRREKFVEIFGLLMFLTFLAYRRITPEMTVIALGQGGVGSEKFDNAMLFWSCWHARWLPPDDYWLSGHRQAYYYFGHFFWAWIGRTGPFPGEWVITLAFSRLISLIWEASYLLIRSFGGRAISASLGAFFIAWGGNPLAFQKALDSYNYTVGREAEPPDKRSFILAPRYLKDLWKHPTDVFSNYDYWKPSRALQEGDITEYPSWTAMLGDFHAHHLSFPWTVAFIALILAGDRWFRLRIEKPRSPPESEQTKSEGEFQSRRAEPARIVRLALWLVSFLTLGVISAISNLWVAPMIGIGSLGILLWRMGLGLKLGNPKRWLPIGLAGCLWTGFVSQHWLFAFLGFAVLALVLWSLRDWAPSHALRLLIVALLGVSMLTGIFISKGSLETPLAAPNAEELKKMSALQKLEAKSPVKYLPPKLRSTLPQLFRHWGFHFGALAAAVGVTILSRKKAIWKSSITLAAAAVALIFLSIGRSKPIPPTPTWLWIAVIALLLNFSWGKRVWFRPLVMVFLIASCVLLGGIELFFLDDAYTGDLERYNTYFKFSYPIWPILTAAAWMGIQRIWYWKIPRPAQFGIRVATLTLFPFVMAMTFFGIPCRTIKAQENDKYPRHGTLDAFSWLTNLKDYDDEGRMLAWIRKYTPPQTRFAEAVKEEGGAYVYVGRVASIAGRPIPLGWEHHEGQWRGFGKGDELIQENKRKVLALYNAPDAATMRKAAKDLGVRYVVFGKSEREIFGGRANAVYQVLREAGKLAAMFPIDEPKSFVFEMPQNP